MGEAINRSREQQDKIPKLNDLIDQLSPKNVERLGQELKWKDVSKDASNYKNVNDFLVSHEEEIRALWLTPIKGNNALRLPNGEIARFDRTTTGLLINYGNGLAQITALNSTGKPDELVIRRFGNEDDGVYLNGEKKSDLTSKKTTQNISQDWQNEVKAGGAGVRNPEQIVRSGNNLNWQWLNKPPEKGFQQQMYNLKQQPSTRLVSNNVGNDIQTVDWKRVR